MTIQEIKIKDLKPYKNNPRINDSAVDAVANSIKEFGFKNPIIVDKNNEIICGHTRLKAAKKLKLDKVPVIRAEDLTDEQVKAYRLTDNKTNELAEWDFSLLDSELDSITDIDMTELGFDKLTEDIDLTSDDEQISSLKDEPKQQKQKKCTCPQCGFEFEVI